MSSTSQQVCIDGRWISCYSAEGYGALGSRYVCDLGISAGQPAKRLLIRHRVWPQTPASGQEALAKLTVGKVPRNGQLGLRPVVVGKYQHKTPRKDGSPQLEVRDIMQQDVTGLIPLKQAILRAVQSSQPQQIWQLFYYACKALDDFGKTVGAERPVPLQCPESLAVDANNRVVPLDAEILVAGSPVDGEASRLYRNWFGENGSKGFADPQTASVMHANALLLYFRQVLDKWQRQDGEGSRPLPAIVTTPLQRMPDGVSLEDCLTWIRDSAESWDIFVDDEESPAAIPNTPSGFDPSRTSPRKKRSLLLRLSLYLNLLLIGTLVVLWLLWPHRSNAVSSAEPASDSALAFSSYAVVFPTQGTISEKVGAALQESFPDKFREIKGHAPDHDKLLQDKMQESIDSIQEVDKLKRLLTRLGDDHSIRFKGFAANNPNEGLKAVIARGGIFTMAALSRQEHGSLLQTNGLEKILDRAGLKDDREAHELLDSLKRAIAEYASLKDALSIIGERTAYLLHVKPTAAAHEQMRQKLLSRLDKPVFISRPIPEFFDAVDPTADSGGGEASYSLRLDRRCFWRQAGKEDRGNVDYANNASNDRMKWQTFEAGQSITWKPIPLTRNNGRTDAVASFDIAVVLSNKVVVFRNQSLMVGDSREQVVMQGKNYITKALKLPIKAAEDAISVRQQGEQFSGTLIYSYLAELVKDENIGVDLEVFNADQFRQVNIEEDNF